MPLPSIPAYALDAHPAAVNRTAWTLEPASAMLLIHDLQNHFVDAFDRTPSSQITLAIAATANLASACRAANVPIVYTAQPPAQHAADRRLLTDFWGTGLATPAAAAIIDELAPKPDDIVLTKWRYSAFHRTDLLDRLRNHDRDQLIITGVYSHIGCLTTALNAFMHDIKVFFVADAQADFSAADHQMALDYVGTRCGQVTVSAEVLDALARVRPMSGAVKV